MAIIKAKTATMAEADKICSIVLDEMSIKNQVEYNRRLDSIEGLTTTGETATQAMVFMVRAISGKWKQVVNNIDMKMSITHSLLKT